MAAGDTDMAASGDVLTAEAVEFLHLLAREFGGEREELLAARHARAAALRGGELPDFLAGTADVRAGDWRVPVAPGDLADRRVEITGPTDRKMVINALNSGARVFMADFEDANSPTWENMVDGQRNLSEAIARTIRLDSGEKVYELNEQVATLLVRPRGWHLLERHFLVDGAADPGRAVRFRAVPVAQPPGACGGGHRPVLLSAQARVASGGAAVEPRVRARAG